MNRYIRNEGLFAASYFERVVADPHFPRERRLPADAPARLELLRQLWEGLRGQFLRDVRIDGRTLPHSYPGLPDHHKPLQGSESQVENFFVLQVCDRVLGYAASQNRSMRLSAAVAGEAKGAQRPDLVLFATAADRDAEAQRTGAAGLHKDVSGAPDGVRFCRSAALIVDAKKFDKGVGADEAVEAGGKRGRGESTAIEDVLQVDRYLRGYERPWGVLTNGRCWRLMRQGQPNQHLRFDLVLFIEEMRGREPTAADLETFGLFWYLFGHPAVAGGYLDALTTESEAATRHVREVLREQAHRAVEEIARGFWSCSSNDDITTAPSLPPQAELDHLREVSLTLLYRLLFILKAEAQGLLQLVNELGALTAYGRKRSTRAIYDDLSALSDDDRSRHSDVYDRLLSLFTAIDRGDNGFGIPAYNGGLFDPEKHPELARWRLLDGALHLVLQRLIYLDEGSTPVPYADLDVRDLGDIYEGLLEQRLIVWQSSPPSLHLQNEKGERKASGSYFTPDAIVDALVRRALAPLLAAAGGDPAKVLALRVLDPGMGSGHFLVKAVDVMADHLTVHCDPEDPEAPRDNGPAERAYWKRKVVESCIYGVDFNPMAVELARVALWLYTAEYGKPLSFLDHHLKVGNSLVGVSLDRLAAPGLALKSTKAGLTWVAVAAPAPAAAEGPQSAAGSEPAPSAQPAKRGRRAAEPTAQLALPFAIDTSLFSGILQSIRGILARPSDSAKQVKAKSQEYARAVGERLAAHRLLADLWCLQWFLGEPDEATVEAYTRPYGVYEQVKRACGLPNEQQRAVALAAVADHPLVQRIMSARSRGYGPRMEAFCHWALEFPEVAFDERGQLRGGFGFDAVIGNPPWDRIRPERRHFYGPYGRPDVGPEWDVANTQGASLEALILRLQAEHPGLAEGWADYEASVTALNRFLRESDIYQHQVVKIDGKKTGGDPDTFRYFVERAFQAVRSGGRVALVVPGTLWQAEGCTGLRRLLLQGATVDELYVFENYRKWAFDIDSRFKFTTFAATARPAPSGHTIQAGFMLRDLRAVHGRLPERLVRLTLPAIEALSPGTLAMLDVQSDGDAQLMARLHQQHPALGSEGSGWTVKYRRELDMTNDAWRFKAREWMEARGFLRVRPERQADGAWVQRREHGSITAVYPSELPPGGEYWVAADAGWYRARGYLSEEQEVGGQLREVFIHPEDAKTPAVKKIPAKQRHRIVPGGRYTALYVGRSIHQHNPTAAAYVSGEGHRQLWTSMGSTESRRDGCYFTLARTSDEARIGFRDIARGTDERTLIATLLAPDAMAGNKVPTLVGLSPSEAQTLTGLLNSFVVDAILRLKVNTTINWTYVGSLPVPNPGVLAEVASLVARLGAVIPELQATWTDQNSEAPWTYGSAERDPWKRSLLRAELDAIIAQAYGLSVQDYARILTGFPLLDRDQPALKGDAFVTDADGEPRGERGVHWEETSFGFVERKPRSFITRDLALLTYMNRLGVRPPDRLDRFYREEVGIDPEGPLSRFRIGEERDLIDRVAKAQSLGAVAYAPSGRGGPPGVEADDEAEEEADELN